MVSKTASAAFVLALSFLAPSHCLAGEEEPIVWAAEGASLADVRRIELYPSSGTSDGQEYLDALNTVTGVMQAELERAGITTVEADRAAHTGTGMTVELVNYQKGDIGGRWIGFGGGAAIGIIRARLYDGQTGRQVADIVAADQIASGGLFSIGAEKHVLDSAARKTAETLAKLLGVEPVPAPAEEGGEEVW